MPYRLLTEKDVLSQAKSGLINCSKMDRLLHSMSTSDGNPTMDEDFNPNGSYYAIEGITSPDGRVLGKMAHSERRGDGVALNICGDQNQLIFESGVEYFK